MRQGFGYVRVSSMGQGGEGKDGVPRQKAAVTRWANANDVEITHWYVDKITGKTDWEKRPAFQEMMTALLADGVKLIVCERLDRIARDLIVQEKIIADLRERGFELISTCEPDLCIDDPSRKMLRCIVGAIAEYDRAMITAKLTAAKERARANPDYKEGRKQFGHREGEQATINRMIELRAMKPRPSIREIVETLNAEGKATRTGKPWAQPVVVRILKRAGVRVSFLIAFSTVKASAFFSAASIFL